MWKLEAGVGVWRWLEARLVFQKNFRAHLLHSALIHHPVYPCWPGDCQHNIYPQSTRGSPSPAGRWHQPEWLHRWNLCHVALSVTLLTAPDCQASVVTCCLPPEEAVARCQHTAEVAGIRAAKKDTTHRHWMKRFTHTESRAGSASVVSVALPQPAPLAP